MGTLSNPSWFKAAVILWFLLTRETPRIGATSITSETFDMPELPNQVVEKLRGGQRVRHDGDPFTAPPRHEEGVGSVMYDGNPFD